MQEEKEKIKMIGLDISEEGLDETQPIFAEVDLGVPNTYTPYPKYRFDQRLALPRRSGKPETDQMIIASILKQRTGVPSYPIKGVINCGISY